MILEINPPQSDSPQEVLGVYGALTRTFVLDMRNLFTQNLEPELGSDWFEKLRNQRKPHFDDTNLNDPTFYLKEPALNPQSPTWKFLPGHNAIFKNNLFKLLRIRNEWAHYAWEPTIKNLSEVISVLADIASVLNLPHSQNYIQIRSRCMEIIGGQFASSSNPFNVLEGLFKKTAEVDEIETNVLAEIQHEVEVGLIEVARQKRPPIGALWEGPVGSRILKLVKTTRDVFDLSGNSVKAELGPQSDVVIAKWLTILNANAELKVSEEDGAIAAPLGGRLHLLGYFGEMPEPDPSQIQGFIGPEKFVVKNGYVVRGGSNVLLVYTPLPDAELDKFEGAEVRVTTHGDVALTNSENLTRIKIGTVPRDEMVPSI